MTSPSPITRPRFSPDGEQIAFFSLRSGRLALWVCDRSGAKARLLAAPSGLTKYPYDWAPDGRTIACTTFNDGFIDICLIDTSSGALRRLANQDRHLIFMAWSADGSALYCRTNRDEHICSARFTLADGHIDDLDPPTTRVLRDEPDGYYYWLPGDRRIRFRAHDMSPTVDPDRGDVVLGPLSPGAHIRTMTLRGDHVYFAESGDGQTTFRRLDTATGHVDSLTAPCPVPSAATSTSRRTAAPCCSTWSRCNRSTSCSWRTSVSPALSHRNNRIFRICGRPAVSRRAK